MKRTITRCSSPAIRRYGLAIATIGLMALGTLPSLAGVNLTSSRSGKPDQRRGAGSRGPKSCFVDSTKTSAALAPENNVGLTLSASPQLLLALPTTLKAGMKVRVTSTTTRTTTPSAPTKFVYEASFPAPPTAGVVSIQVPDSLGLEPLAVGGTYNVSVTLACEPSTSESEVAHKTFTTRIQRIAPPLALTKSLEGVKGLDHVGLLARNGIWVDALAELSDLRCRDPKNPKVQQAWLDLLKSVDLAEAATLPFLKSCGAG
jgi:hypothetical protein